MTGVDAEDLFKLAAAEDQQPIEAVGCTYSIFLQINQFGTRG
jgi:hypothetical protein